MYKVLLTKKAEKEFFALPADIRKRTVSAFEEMANLGTKASNTKKLQTPFPGYRKRVGDYRILYECNDELLVIYKISKRSDVYR